MAGQNIRCAGEASQQNVAVQNKQAIANKAPDRGRQDFVPKLDNNGPDGPPRDGGGGGGGGGGGWGGHYWMFGFWLMLLLIVFKRDEESKPRRQRRAYNGY